MKRHICVVIVTIAISAACSQKSKTSSNTNKDASVSTHRRTTAINNRVSVVPEAAGAGDLFLDTSGRRLAIEHTEWRWEEYSSNASEVPPVLRVLDLDGSPPDPVVNGWRLFGPDAAGALTFLTERNNELDYWVASTGIPGAGKKLVLPEGTWIFDRAVSAGDLGVLTFSNGDRRVGVKPLLLVSVDPKSLEARASGERALAVARINKDRRATGIAGSTRHNRFVLLSGTGNTWTLDAIDADAMKSAWSTTLPIPPKDASGLPYDFSSGIVGIAGDDSSVVVVLGTDARVGVEAHLAFSVDLSTGKVMETANAPVFRAVSGVIAAIAPVPGKASVLLLHRHSLQEPTDTSFAGVSELQLPSCRATPVLEVDMSLGGPGFKQARTWDPASLVVRSDGSVLVAPTVEAPGATGSGRDRPSVKGHVTTPADWHHQTRP
ncbi:MAG: hypothetical protein K8M05_13100 [Deltaproteobacteria bacterium]|nr:hypothetical protein [Kofleriaceae bacterium]